MKGWLFDNSAAARERLSPFREQLNELSGKLCVCPVIQLERRYSARSASEYDAISEQLTSGLVVVEEAPDAFSRALELQRDLAHHHGMWHRIPIPDLLIAVTALHHGLGIVHVDSDFDKIAEVRPLVARRLG
ncbi:MAG: PIN domain-containing protein [Pseudonocardia sp.]|nr:PIN domain-containing protein [Pseudonocardia sp.]